nr:MAG TPA: hypothetical protein [Caudoviricetes sp.]
MHLLRVQGFYFCPAAYQPHTSVYSGFSATDAFYSLSAKAFTGRYRSFSCDYARSTARDTRPTQAAIISPAPRWSVSQRRSASTDTRYHRYAERCTAQHRPLIIIR